MPSDALDEVDQLLVGGQSVYDEDTTQASEVASSQLTRSGVGC